jgi:Bifunctional DNA primase/polymerase, N-terminal/AAA domain
MSVDNTGRAGALPVLPAALEYAERGLKVIPVDKDTKQPASHNGVQYGITWATSNSDRIRQWFTDMPDAGVGIVCRASGLVVIDADRRNGANLAVLDRLCDMPATFTVRTPGGMHWYFKDPGLPKLRGQLDKGRFPGFDVKHDGYVVAAPTVRTDGGEYTIVADEDFATMPDALVEACRLPERPPNPNGSNAIDADKLGVPSMRELLSSAGWTLHSEHGGETWWTRPGKDPAEGVSAVHGHSGNDTLKVFTTSTVLPSDDGTLTRLGVYAHLHHGGDFGRAQRHLTLAKIKGRSTIPETGDEDDPDESWQRVDLGPVLEGTVLVPTPTVLCREDGAALFTSGCVNYLHGDSGAGKSMVAAITVAQELEAGRHVIWIDFEDSHAGVLLERLRDTLGVTDDAIRECLHYYGPLEPFDNSAVAVITYDAVEHDVVVIVIDSLGEAFGLEAIDENKDVEVAPWMRRVARQLAAAGPAVLPLDHSTKAGDNPLFPSGSKRKRAAVTGQHYFLEAPQPLTREKGGRLTLKCAKDRHGHYERGKVAAVIELTTYPDGGTTVHVRPPTEDQEDAPSARLWFLARAAVQALKDAGKPLSQRGLTERMDIKASDNSKRAGIEEAESRGCLRISEGPRRSLLHHYIRDLEPFGAPSSATAADRGPSAADAVPQAVTDDCGSASPPIGDADADAVAVDSKNTHNPASASDAVFVSADPKRFTR